MTRRRDDAMIIALCGRRRCGKDTLARFLAREHGFVNCKFSGRLKDACRLLFGFTHDQVEGNAKDVGDARWGRTPREVLQFFGTEMMQHKLAEFLPEVGRAFWVRTLVDDELAKHARVVVTDVRFRHEAAALAARGALVVRITRPSPPDATHDAVDAHPSEAEVATLPADVELVNDATPAELYARLCAAPAYRAWWHEWAGGGTRYCRAIESPCNRTKQHER